MDLSKLQKRICPSCKMYLSKWRKRVRRGHPDGPWLDLWGGIWQRRWVDPLTYTIHTYIHRKDGKKWNRFVNNVSDQCVFCKQIQFDLILWENFPFLVLHLYAWASPQARSLCICKQHEDAFVLQNWLSHAEKYVPLKYKIWNHYFMQQNPHSHVNGIGFL